MKQLFLTVLSLSLSGTLTGLIVSIAHPVTEKYFSKRWNYYIWLLVVAQLVLPLHLMPALSGRLNWQIDLNQMAADSVGNVEKIQTTHADNLHIMQEQPDAATPSFSNASAGIPNGDIAGSSGTIAQNNAASHIQNDTLSFHVPFSAGGILTVTASLWLFGAVTALSVRLLHYYTFKSRLKKNCVRVTDNRVIMWENILCTKLHIATPPAIYESGTASGPMTIGLWNPIVVIPKAFFGQDALLEKDSTIAQLQLVLHHELIHVRRKDLLYKWIYQLLLCIHWFNPVLYHIGGQINSDCELSCDETILSKLTESGKQLYGNILLDTAAFGVNRKESALSTPLLERNKDLKKRLDGILRYRKTTHMRIALSVCTLAVMLTLSACSTVWISSSDVSTSNSQYSNPDDAKGADLGDAWKVYDDDELLAGENIQDNFEAYNYASDGRRLRVSGLVLYGSHSVVIAYADREVDVKIQSSFEVSEGNFKIVYIAPDKSVVTLNDAGADTTQTVTMQKGRNVLKIVGQGAKIKNLEIDYSDLRESEFENIFDSESEEYSIQIKDALISGEPLNKDKVIDTLYCLSAKDSSDAFNALLASGNTFTDDELCAFFIYSDAALSSRYLVDAVKAGNIEPLSGRTISKLMPYLTEDCASELLKSLPVEEFYDVFEENICCLNSSQIDECLTDYMERGGVITYSMYDEISPYVNRSTLQKLDRQLSTLQGLP